MNIPGPVKTNEQIRKAFDSGKAELLKALSCDSSMQLKMLSKEIKKNIPSVIASEWNYENIKFFVQKLVNSTLISINIEEKIQIISNNFERVSKNGLQFDKTVWTIKGLVHHPFWENQRQLAKELLNELYKIQP